MPFFFNKPQKPKEKQEIIVEPRTVKADKRIFCSNCFRSEKYCAKYYMPDGKAYFEKKRPSNYLCDEDGYDVEPEPIVMVWIPYFDITQEEFKKASLDFNNKFPELQKKLEAY